ncbi:uncharacterized protein LY79DRAFT_543270, partial [Colletotrichum navitas]
MRFADKVGPGVWCRMVAWREQATPVSQADSKLGLGVSRCIDVGGGFDAAAAVSTTKARQCAKRASHQFGSRRASLSQIETGGRLRRTMAGGGGLKGSWGLFLAFAMAGVGFARDFVCKSSAGREEAKSETHHCRETQPPVGIVVVRTVRRWMSHAPMPISAIQGDTLLVPARPRPSRPLRTLGAADDDAMCSLAKTRLGVEFGPGTPRPGCHLGRCRATVVESGPSSLFRRETPCCECLSSYIATRRPSYNPPGGEGGGRAYC